MTLYCVCISRSARAATVCHCFPPKVVPEHSQKVLFYFSWNYGCKLKWILFPCLPAKGGFHGLCGRFEEGKEALRTTVNSQQMNSVNSVKNKPKISQFCSVATLTDQSLRIFHPHYLKQQVLQGNWIHFAVRLPQINADIH